MQSKSKVAFTDDFASGVGNSAISGHHRRTTTRYATSSIPEVLFHVIVTCGRTQDASIEYIPWVLRLLQTKGECGCDTRRPEEVAELGPKTLGLASRPTGLPVQSTRYADTYGAGNCYLEISTAAEDAFVSRSDAVSRAPDDATRARLASAIRCPSTQPTLATANRSSRRTLQLLRSQHVYLQGPAALCR